MGLITDSAQSKTYTAVSELGILFTYACLSRYLYIRYNDLVVFLLTVPRRFLCCFSSLFVRRWFHIWSLFCHYFFLISFFWSLGKAVPRFVVVTISKIVKQQLFVFLLFFFFFFFCFFCFIFVLFFVVVFS